MTDIRRVLAAPGVYELCSSLLGGARGRRTLVREHVRPRPGARVLDLGCGPGELLRHLGGVHYVGIDISERYIEQARRSFGSLGAFRVGDVRTLDPDLGGFDLVLAFGVLHHLNEEGAKCLIGGAAAALKSSGRFISVDPTLAPGENRRLANLLISWDRGEHVRSPADYCRIAKSGLAEVHVTVRTDLLRVPYTHCVLEGTAPDAGRAEPVVANPVE